MQKDWDDHVVHAEEVARGAGFRDLRDRIVALAGPMPGDVVVDVGSGTGLLALALAGRVARVWAVDVAPAMSEYLSVKAASAGFQNVETVTASAVSLPLVDASADLVVSNYCLHHLHDAEKARALHEVHRVLRPGGRFVLGDMMFAVSLSDPRDRQVVIDKVRALLRKGAPGVVRLARNGLRIASRRWEQPVRATWWEQAMVEAGFEEIRIEVLEHEGGVAAARKPVAASPQAAVPLIDRTTSRSGPRSRGCTR